MTTHPRAVIKKATAALLLVAACLGIVSGTAAAETTSKMLNGAHYAIFKTDIGTNPGTGTEFIAWDYRIGEGAPAFFDTICNYQSYTYVHYNSGQDAWHEYSARNNGCVFMFALTAFPSYNGSAYPTCTWYAGWWDSDSSINSDFTFIGWLRNDDCRKKR